VRRIGYQVALLDRIDHDHDRFAQLIILSESAKCVVIDGRIGQQYVLNPRAGEPDGLG
jgi:hypothetical protein